MARRFVLIGYDVTNDRRRARIAKTLLDYGDRIQYSIFCCQVNARELLRLKGLLGECVNAEDDRILFIDAGEVKGQKPMPEISTLGQAWTLETRSQII
jgi:CRISPR-associated protein Cas2